jgi:Protein of unknown function (DUF4058)
MRNNPYVGINAHLNSMLQTPGVIGQPALWHPFHGRHIARLADALIEQLPPRYFAINEQSLQTRTLDIGEWDKLRHPTPDLTIFQRGGTSPMPGVAAIAPPTWEGQLIDLVENLPQPQAIIIREMLSQNKLGRIVARIELLSPSNKWGGSDYRGYESKRIESILSGVPLIEIDYLHESPAPYLQLPRYPIDDHSLPYRIIVSDPRPTWAEGKARVYAWGVGEPIKMFPLPLADDEILPFNIDPIYQQTFRAGAWGDLVDYTADPERMDTYSANDQAIIRRIMSEVAGKNEW